MKTQEDLKEFYKTSLLGYLKTLEKERQLIVSKVVALGIVSLLVIFLMFRVQILFLFIPVFILAGIWFFFKIIENYGSSFQAKINQKIIAFIDKNLAYSPRGHIPKRFFSASKIFMLSPDICRGENYVSGKIGQTMIEFSEVHAMCVIDFGSNKMYSTLFRGLFIAADFNKSFSGNTVVLPDTAERLFGYLGPVLQSWNTMRGELIKLEDPEFEKEFVVYGTDQIESRYILSTSLMKKIVDFKKKIKRQVYISFAGPKIFVAIPYKKPLMRIKLFSTMLDFRQIQEYFEVIILTVGIVDDLNLNTHIWTK